MLGKSYFVNVSNHPSDKWTSDQLNAAKKLGEVVDIPFPNVPSTASPLEVDELVQQTLDQVINIDAWDKNQAKVVYVLIQGEMTFVFRFVSKAMKHKRIMCVAATSERRKVEVEQGKFEMNFQFVQFRSYY